MEIIRGLLFNSSIKQYESSKNDFEKQQVINAFIDEHKPVVEQSLRDSRSQESKLPFREKLEQSLHERTDLRKSSSRVSEPLSKGENSASFNIKRQVTLSFSFEKFKFFIFCVSCKVLINY